MKKITVLIGLAISAFSYAQNSSSSEEIIVNPEKRTEATKGTYQLIFKDHASKDWFFSKGILTASKYVGVGGIVTYSDLLIVIHENRQKEKEQEFIIGENGEAKLIVLPLAHIKSDQFKPLEEFIYKNNQ